MFKVSRTRLFQYDWPLITSGYRELLFDDMPILFVGRNDVGEHVIGSSVDENHKIGIERYFHIVVSEDDYEAYFGGKRSYRALLEKARPIFVIDRYYRSGKWKIYHYVLGEVPEEYRPSEHSYVPRSAYQPSGLYEFPLDGGIADQHRAFPSDVAKTQNYVAEFLGSGLSTLQHYLDLKFSTFSRPSYPSSYGMAFEVSLDSEPTLFVTAEDCWDYLNAYIVYCLQYLPREAPYLINGEHKNSQFSQLVSKASALMNKLGVADQLNSEIRESVRVDVMKAPELISGLAATVGSHYGSLRISNNDFPLGKIDDSYVRQFLPTMEHLSELVAETSLEDTVVSEFEIHVYDFNKNTGKGFADLKQVFGETVPVRLTIEKYDASSQARKFTGSEHEATFIRVKGRLTRLNGQPQKIIVIEDGWPGVSLGKTRLLLN